jgi:3D (Asp-Asp-Asp) domain-containing protein
MAEASAKGVSIRVPAYINFMAMDRGSEKKRRRQDLYAAQRNHMNKYSRANVSNFENQYTGNRVNIRLA